jgi:hypothetical protein
LTMRLTPHTQQHCGIPSSSHRIFL